MKRGSFPHRRLCCPQRLKQYYDPLRLPLGRPDHFPGSPVIGGHRFPSPRRRRGQDGSPEFPRRPSARSTPNTPKGPSAPASGSQAPSMAFAVNEPARLPLYPPEDGPLDDAYSGFTHVADRAIASAPLRTRPLDHARGHRYQGPRRLPGPDSHRQAILNLSLAMSCRSPSLHGSRAVSAHPPDAALREQFFAAVEEIMALDSCACGRGPSGVLDGQFV